MGTLSDADHVWNRAAQWDWDGPPATAAGDRALAALLRVDAQIMNGGLESALEYIAPDDVAAAADGFAFFGRNDLAARCKLSIDEVERDFDIDGQGAQQARPAHYFPRRNLRSSSRSLPPETLTASTGPIPRA
jgi:hypothetical protein